MTSCVLISEHTLYEALRGGSHCDGFAYADWDTSAITNFNGIFKDLVLPENTSGFKTWVVSNAISMFETFYNTTFSTTNHEFLEAWALQISESRKLEETSFMFAHSNIDSLFVERMAEWRSVTDMSFMFYGSKIRTIGKGIDTASVTSFQSMFQDANFFIGNGAENFTTGEATDMRAMFKGASVFNADLGNWSIEFVTDLSEMFYGAGSFTGSGMENWKAGLPLLEVSSMFEEALVRVFLDIVFQDFHSFHQHRSSMEIYQTFSHLEIS